MLAAVGSEFFPAWSMPVDEHAAAFARSVAKTICAPLGMPESQAYDLKVALSELATNVHRHAYGPAEIWAYVRWGTRPELVVKVFDAAPWRGAIQYGPMAEGGRGIEVVKALTREYGGGWGVHRTRSRLWPTPVEGKAVVVAMPIPAPPAPMRVAPRQVAQQVYELLEERGLDRLQVSYGHGMAVICVRAGVHVWVREDSISYCMPGKGTKRYALYDAIELVEQVVSFQ